VALRNKKDISVRLYEKTAAFDPIAGAGMSFWPRIVAIFKKWGIEKEFEEIVTQPLAEDRGMPLSLRIR
jgi:2-polyprenyl-6-methoxyphenol hydroxylase-like FAD-dependent oxidoreductase